MSLEETASRRCASHLQSSEVHGTKENLLEQLRREFKSLINVQLMESNSFSSNCSNPQEECCSFFTASSHWTN